MSLCCRLHNDLCNVIDEVMNVISQAFKIYTFCKGHDALSQFNRLTYSFTTPIRHRPPPLLNSLLHPVSIPTSPPPLSPYPPQPLPTPSPSPSSQPSHIQSCESRPLRHASSSFRYLVSLSPDIITTNHPRRLLTSR